MDNRDDAEPEIRPSSIRGQLRMWYRTLHPNPKIAPSAEKQLFGGVGKPAIASSVVVRVANIQSTGAETTPTLPHKQGGHAAPKKAFQSGTSFVMQVVDRRQGINEQQEKELQKAIEGWLLMGGLGLRVTRAAGSLQWDQLPNDVATYQQRLDEITRGTKIRAAVLGNTGEQDSNNLRRIASDTIGGHQQRDEKQSLDRIAYPLGGINLKIGGQKIQRKTSPLRFTIRKFTDGYRLIAVWDGSVYGPFGVGTQLVAALKNKGKTIGSLLEPALPRLMAQ
jgi:hypothetical protein